MIDVFLLFIEDYNLNVLQEYRKYLSADEIVTMGKFAFQKDRDQYLLTRAMVRKVVSQRTGRHFSSLQFENNLYGKPKLKDTSAAISFNVSHTSGLIALAFSECTAGIGVDIENTSRDIDLEIRDSFFTAQELLIYEEVPEADKKNYFFELWTLKESYMKAIGKGFSISPRSFGFKRISNSQYNFRENQLESVPGEFRFHLTDIVPFYKLAICYSNGSLILAIHRVLPGWEIADLEVSRSVNIL